jgi:hypothetical protein
VSDAEVPLPEVIGFEHGFFRMVDDAHFRMSEPQEGRAMLVGMLGEHNVALPLRGIAREFRIDEESPDGIMLDLVGRGLKFVPILKVGDRVPLEVLSGRASWEPEPEYEILAQKRIALQIVTWHRGAQKVLIDSDAIDAELEKDGDGAKGQDAMDALAEKLNLEDPQAVIDTVVAEVARIEMLRDRYREICRIKRKLDVFMSLRANEMSVVTELDSVLRLIAFPIRQFSRQLREADAGITDVEAIFAQHERVCATLEAQRNELFSWMSAWTGVVEAWQTVDPSQPGDFSLLDQTRRLNRFLAPRYMPVDEWNLTLVTSMNKAEADYRKAMAW